MDSSSKAKPKQELIEKPDSSKEIRSSQGQFVPGVSGNPAGRRKSTELQREVKTKVLALLEKESLEVVAKILEQAKAGKQWACKLVWQSLIPSVRSEDGSQNAKPVVLINIGDTSGPRPIDVKAEVVLDVSDNGGTGS